MVTEGLTCMPAPDFEAFVYLGLRDLVDADAYQDRSSNASVKQLRLKFRYDDAESFDSLQAAYTNDPSDSFCKFSSPSQ